MANRGVKVEAARTTRGRPATTVSVEVRPAVVRAEIGAMAEIEEVVAAVPVRKDGAVRWTEEHLDKVSEERSASGEPSKQTFAATHYGGCDAVERGVRVKLRTAAEAVLTHASSTGAASHGVREEDQPGPPAQDASPEHGK